MNSLRNILWFASAAVLVACGRDSTPDAAETAGATAQAMADMPGMQAGDTAMIGQMRSHMRMMDGLSGDSIKAMLPMHRQMLGNMLSQFDRDMSAMKMAPDPAWNALTDSLRQDNIRLPEMSASELRTAMPAHRARVTRLIDMHHAMMGSMKKP